MLLSKLFLAKIFDIVQVMWSTLIWSRGWIMHCLTKSEVRLTRSQMLEMILMESLGNKSYMMGVDFLHLLRNGQTSAFGI